MVQNLRSLVLRTDITSRPEEQEHNPRSRPHSPAPFLPPISPLPSIEVTTPTGETTAPAPPQFEGSPTAYNSNQTANWKEREAEFDRQFSFPPRDMPAQPPPAYTSTGTPTTASNLTNRQRRLNLPKLTPNHGRVSSINPAKSPIDGRKWHEKRRTIASVLGVSITLLLIALIINYCYILPKLRDSHKDEDAMLAQTSDDIPSAQSLTGHWNMTSVQLETVSLEDTTVVDMCASKDSEFDRCVDNRFLAPDAAEKYNFDLSMNEDGSFTGIFAEGIFSQNGKTEVKLTPSRYGLMSSWVYTADDVNGKLTIEGCSYQRSALILVTFENGKPTYKITEKQMVYSSGECSLPQGRRDDSCQCMFIGTRPHAQKKRR
ncbi:hypothetical protein ABW20_dc0109641 [Dactylellina cionopaga]|nr:hypothetical protein ABW20_dc0109641 [Dactylellina cionopaga]